MAKIPKINQAYLNEIEPSGVGGVFRADVVIYGTIYVKADSEREAAEKIYGVRYDSIEIPCDGNPGMFDIPVSGLMINNPELPEVSLSPVMTVYGPGDYLPPGEKQAIINNALEMVAQLMEAGIKPNDSHEACAKAIRMLKRP